MENKVELSGLIGYGILVLYWVSALIFGAFVCIIRWQEYVLTGTTSNSMTFGLLLFLTICLGLAIVMVSFGIWFYITQIKSYNKEKRELYENRKI